MTGLACHPTLTLADRALDHLQTGPRSSAELARDILGLPNAPRVVADRLAVALLGADPRVCQLADGRWDVVRSARPSPMLADCSFAVVDVETTGMRAGGSDRITEIAVVAVSGGRVEVVVDALVNPGRPIPPRITMVTGITDAMVSRAPAFAEVSDAVTAALAGRVFVAHHARFDWAFVSAEVRRARALALAGPQLCTVRLARRLLRGQVQSCGLDALSAYFGFENPARHRAAGDALVTARLLARLIDLAGDRGAVTFDDLILMRAARHA